MKLGHIDIKALNEIDSERGRLAHAHFETSPGPGDDSYRLVSPRTGNALEEQYRDYDADKIKGLTQRIHKLSQRLLAAEYILAFRIGAVPREVTDWSGSSLGSDSMSGSAIGVS